MDKITISGLRAIAIIGCLPHERELPQPLELDLVLECALADCGRSDELGDTVNYGAVADQVVKLVQASRDQMLERLAHRVAEHLLGFARVSAVKVRIRKPHAPIPQLLDHVAVTIRRTAADVPPPAPRARAIVALGTNLGDRMQHLRSALRELSPIATSSIFETAPIGGPANQGPFLNMVAIVETELDPFAFLRKCQRIEAAAGRQRRERWGARTLDLDLLFYDDFVIKSPELTVPHPRHAERGFVLAPLHEVAPERCPPDWQNQLTPDVVRYAATPY